MNRTELVAAVAKTTGQTQVSVEATVKAIEAEITNQFVAGNGVQLIGFGSFKVTPVEARKGRNPQTGEAIDIAATKRVTFSVADSTKEKLKG